jgi:hypothetical protein
VLVRLYFDANAVALLQPLGDIVRSNALTGAIVRLVAHGGNKEMRLIADLTA